MVSHSYLFSLENGARSVLEPQKKIFPVRWLVSPSIGHHNLFDQEGVGHDGFRDAIL